MTTGGLPDLDAIVDGFFTYLLEQLPAGLIRTSGRRVIDWKKVEDQPALFCRHVYDDDEWSGDGLPIVKITVQLWGYVKTEGPDGVPDSNLSDLVSAIRTALKPPVHGGNLTLEDTITGIKLFYRCRIENRTFYDSGDSDEQGKVIIPVVLLITP